ncbi:hypothetical protein BGZ98_005304 [Dissophora globulifera]|nr:hypothetical protein BGZ98_005304 [Dissophora globulifera]
MSGHNPTRRLPSHYLLPNSTKVRVDRRAHGTLFTHMKKFGDPSRMVFYVDEAEATEKKDTHRMREVNSVKSLKNTHASASIFKARVEGDKSPTRQMFKNIEIAMRRKSWSTTKLMF